MLLALTAALFSQGSQRVEPHRGAGPPSNTYPRRPIGHVAQGEDGGVRGERLQALQQVQERGRSHHGHRGDARRAPWPSAVGRVETVSSKLRCVSTVCSCGCRQPNLVSLKSSGIRPGLRLHVFRSQGGIASAQSMSSIQPSSLTSSTRHTARPRARHVARALFVFH